MSKTVLGKLRTLSSVILINLVVIEALGYFVSSGLLYSGALFSADDITQPYSEYLKARDPVLGWSPQRNENSISGIQVEADGSKKDPHFDAAERACMSMFGDSFTWAAEVPDAKGWVALLSRRLGCRVANFGVSGYGSDQSLLRYESLPASGKVVFLNHLSENIIRNINQFRNLIYPSAEFAFKPRFVYKSDQLALVATPTLRADEVGAFLAQPAHYLSDEWFIPGGPSGVEEYRLPYSWRILQVALKNYHVRAKVRNIPRHSEFYDEAHPSQALRITEGIFQSFETLAAARAQTPVITIIPTCDDLKYFQRHGRFVYEPLTSYVEARHWLYIDFGKQLAQHLNGQPPESLYISCSGHFNEAGYALLSEISAEFVHRLVPSMHFN